MPIPDHENRPPDLDFREGDVPVSPEQQAQAQMDAAMDIQTRLAEAMESQAAGIQQISFCLQYFLKQQHPEFEQAFDSMFPEVDEDDEDGEDGDDRDPV